MATTSDPRPFGLTKPIVFREIALTGSEEISDVPAAPTISVGTGDPNGSLDRPQGSIFLATDGDGDSTLFLNTDGSTAWAAATSSGAGGSQADLIFDAASELTIASGVITATQAAHTVDTESDAGSDDLDSILGGTAEEVLVIRPANAARTVVLKHAIGADLIACPGGRDISLAEATDFALLYYDGTQWLVLAASTLALDAQVAGVSAALDVVENKVVHATIAVADTGGGGTDAALTLSLQQADNSTDLTGARQVMIASGAAQYIPRQALNGNATFGSATTGSIIDSGNGWALVQTDAAGDFACTVSNSSDEAVYFWAESANKTSSHGAGCVVAASNSDLATWSS